MKLSKAERQAKILNELSGTASLRVAELAGRMGVSTETIRRDLDELTDKGLLNRTYGGATRSLSSEPSVSERHTLHVTERERIAKATIPLLKDARILMIGSGSTTVHVARRIASEMRDITVLTHAFGVATVLSMNPTIRVLMLPGEYHAEEGATIGVHTVSFLDNYFADAAILGASGLSEEGPSDALIEAAAIYSAMVRRAASTIVVADHSKHNRIFPARYARWREVTHLVTDTAPDGDVARTTKKYDVKVRISG
ncbi:DeoR/GlpR family DNA-binding transcription regulator [Martelella endophytica]|uniref:DeoR faimly transcriptional regulator n=1 Tax=Martelella endophytica TaxID=1486262 RepID=A0A0D5LUW5_MAREN|nr:DeoR/GlpR family DNA-binding transcription regulator [Martelella endophytica]AJY47740.1 DeoR faimly transcriptional regulator [Martelella endophytica]